MLHCPNPNPNIVEFAKTFSSNKNLTFNLRVIMIVFDQNPISFFA